MGPMDFSGVCLVCGVGLFSFFPPPGGQAAPEFIRPCTPIATRSFICGAPGASFIISPMFFWTGICSRNPTKSPIRPKAWNICEHVLDKGQGGILLMSHMGNWEVAAHLLKRKLKNLRLLLYMGVRQKEQIEQLQKETIAQSGIRIIAVDEGGGSPLDLVEGIKFIESGGVVSLTGDLVWKKDQRTIPVKFLGQEILLPEAPHLFALLSGAPLFIFFAFRTGRNTYRFTLSEPIYLAAASRDERAGQFGTLLKNTPKSSQQPFAIIPCSGTISDLF